MQPSTDTRAAAGHLWWLLVLPIAVAACATTGCGARQTSAPVVIADAPQCPPPPSVFDSAAAATWLRGCRDMGGVAAERVARAMTAAQAAGQTARAACLRQRHTAIDGLRRRIGAERIALGGLGRERAVQRVRRHCLRIQQMVAEAQAC